MGVLISRVQQGVYLADLITDQYQALTVLLVKSPLPEGPPTDLAAVVAAEADFTGYARLTAQDMGAPVFGQDGLAVSESPLLEFAATGAGTSNTVYGYALVDSGVTVLSAYELFEFPWNISNNGDVVAFVARINFPLNTSDAIVIV